VENTASLRSDIRLPKLTSARTCSRYEKRPVVFPVPPVHPSEDNERMRRAENEIRRHRPGETEESVTTRTRDSPKVPKNYVALVEMHLQAAGLCSELKGFREKVALRVDFTSRATWRVCPTVYSSQS
jgi:hypothetical protein